MDIKQFSLKQILPTVIFCGLIGGILLIGTSSLSIKGYWSILTYVIVMFATIFIVRFSKKIEVNYIETFFIGFLTFMIMTYIKYFHVEFFKYPTRVVSVWQHTWRFFAIIGFALVSSSILGLFFIKWKKKEM